MSFPTLFFINEYLTLGSSIKQKQISKFCFCAILLNFLFFQIRFEGILFEKNFFFAHNLSQSPFNFNICLGVIFIGFAFLIHLRYSKVGTINKIFKKDKVLRQSSFWKNWQRLLAEAWFTTSKRAHVVWKPFLMRCHVSCETT